MSIHPELAEFPKEAVAAPIIGYARTQLQGRNNGWHSHDAAQLFHVIRGSIAIDTEMGTYFVPPERAVWLPPRVSHQTRYLTDTELRYIYVQYDYTRDLPQTPQVMQVTTLLRALILEFMSYPRSETDKGPAARIAAVILDQLKMLPVAPLQLPMPQDVRLRDLCEGVVRFITRDPSNQGHQSNLAAVCVVSQARVPLKKRAASPRRGRGIDQSHSHAWTPPMIWGLSSALGYFNALKVP